MVQFEFINYCLYLRPYKLGFSGRGGIGRHARLRI